MTAKTDVRSGMSYGWDLGESNWNIGMDADIVFIGKVGVHLSIKNSTTAAPPSSPANGDTYIVGAGATGAWAAKDNNVAVWDGLLATPAWVFYPPRLGWVCFDESNNKLRAYYGSAWSVGIAI